jgi:hypothetical protein
MEEGELRKGKGRGQGNTRRLRGKVGEKGGKVKGSGEGRR